MKQNITQKKRVLFLLIYFSILLLINKHLFDNWLPLTTEQGLWFYTGLAALLIGNLIVTPYFTSPANSFAYAITAIIALISFKPTERIEFFYIIIGFCFLILLLCLLNILLKDSKNQTRLNFSNTARIIVENIGGPRPIYALILIYSLYVFHFNSTQELFFISLAGLIVITQFIEKVYYLLYKIYYNWIKKINPIYVGEIAAYQTPALILVRVFKNQFVNKNQYLLISDPYFGIKLGISLGYTSRDEGLLLRILELDMPRGLTEKLKENLRIIPENYVTVLTQEKLEDFKQDIEVLDKWDNFLGIVDIDTSIEYLFIEVVNETEITEGDIVETNINKSNVLYQVLDGLTREDIIFQKNKYGYVRAKARKIGTWIEAERKFQPIEWLPNINSPVFLRKETRGAIPIEAIGRFPKTNYYVSIKNINELVTHNTAILGILGIGKTMLSLELTERLVKENIRVICIDLTNQYETELKDFIDTEKQTLYMDALKEFGESGKINYQRNLEEGGSINQFSREINRQIKEFMDDGNIHKVLVYNPTKFEVWKQTGGVFNGVAAMASLTPPQITQIIAESALSVCQVLGMTSNARLCLILEESHSLTPERYSIVFEGDNQATSGTSRAILQGRKYGLGCFLVSQRTANVTKTILNQCNTIFAMRTFDDTGKDFLSNYIGSSYTSILSSLPERHAVFYGKASSCENPVLIELNKRDEFLRQFRNVTANNQNSDANT